MMVMMEYCYACLVLVGDGVFMICGVEIVNFSVAFCGVLILVTRLNRGYGMTWLPEVERAHIIIFLLCYLFIPVFRT